MDFLLFVVVVLALAVGARRSTGATRAALAVSAGVLAVVLVATVVLSIPGGVVHTTVTNFTPRP